MGNIYLDKEEAQTMVELIDKELDKIRDFSEEFDCEGNTIDYVHILQVIHDKLLDHVEE